MAAPTAPQLSQSKEGALLKQSVEIAAQASQDADFRTEMQQRLDDLQRQYKETVSGYNEELRKERQRLADAEAEITKLRQSLQEAEKAKSMHGGELAATLFRQQEIIKELTRTKAQLDSELLAETERSRGELARVKSEFEAESIAARKATEERLKSKHEADLAQTNKEHALALQAAKKQEAAELNSQYDTKMAAQRKTIADLQAANDELRGLCTRALSEKEEAISAARRTFDADLRAQLASAAASASTKIATLEAEHAAALYAASAAAVLARKDQSMCNMGNRYNCKGVVSVCNKNLVRSKKATT